MTHLTDEHRQYLLAAAIKPEILDASGIRSTPKGIAFPWADGLGNELTQMRPDEPYVDENGRAVKYTFPAGSTMILNRLRDDGPDAPVLICEGTKQQYAALSWAPPQYAVYGVAGCWCWTDADLTWTMGRTIYVLFDGDVTTNADVHKAACDFKDALELNGAESVRFVRTPARGNEGLDDILARVGEERRATFFELWLSKAVSKLPKAPAAKPANPHFDKSGLLVQQATEKLLENQPAALTAERKVALYAGGVYHLDGAAFLSAVADMLGDQFRPNWRTAMEEMAVGLLFKRGLSLPERSPYRKLNVANGMLDLDTLELSDHSPEYLSTQQLPVEWNPDALAPVYEKWLSEVCPEQAEDLEEVTATMLDPTRTPSKAVFLFGPSRSGKSTWLRFMQAVAGVENRTAVTLHDLATDRFAAANVYGKILNAAADLSARHVEDLSVFKMMTGEDPIHANRKYGAQFTFTNQALFAFSANELPTVGESSGAYRERIKPFHFPHTFAGRENPALEAKMREELPGILVRWVKAYQRLGQRGTFLPTLARVREEFDTRSDRVAQWVSEVCVIEPATYGQSLPEAKCTVRREAARAFSAWAERNGGHRMGERKVFDRLAQIPGVVEVRAGRKASRAFNIVIRQDPDSAAPAVSEHPAHMNSSPTSLAPTLAMLGAREGEVEVYGEGASKLPEPPHASALGFDLETASAGQLFTGGQSGPYVRLAGYETEEYGLIEPATAYPPQPFRRFLEALENAETIYAHNGFGFDLIALARHCGADYDALAAKMIDTKVLAVLQDPPQARSHKSYTLDAVAERLGVAGKTDDLPALAKKWGGYDQIPLDDPQYNDYLRGDLTALQAVYRELGGDKPLSDYAAREMRVMALLNRMTLNGWKIDTELLAERVERERKRRADAIAALHEEFGLPLAPPDKIKVLKKEKWPEDLRAMKADAVRALAKTDPGRAVKMGVAVREPQPPYKKPWSTDVGKAAIINAFAKAGAPHVPRTPKSGELALGKDVLGEGEWYDPIRKDSFPGMLRAYGHLPGVRRLVELILAATGATDKYAEIAQFVTAEGRAHASIGAAQASGRFGMVEPSFTNMGKRGEAGEQRAVLVADDGHVLLSCDLSQVDVRAVAGHCQDQKLISMLQPGQDYHSEMAEIYFGDRSRRDEGKPISHGSNYGESATAIAKRNGLDVAATAEAKRRLEEGMPDLAAWKLAAAEQAATGELLDNGFGRMMRPDPERAYTQGPALLGQGAARDIMCESLLRLDDMARQEGRNVRPYLRAVVHDEVVLSVPEDEVEVWSDLLRRAFTWEWRGVPILCDVSKPAYRWSECK